jgi:hypothetical protein
MLEAPAAFYTTNLSKAQGLVPETMELLALWHPGMSAIELKSLVKQTGALGRATETRINDVVTRGFAQRYLIEEGRPASWLKLLVESGVNRSALHPTTRSSTTSSPMSSGAKPLPIPAR